MKLSNFHKELNPDGTEKHIVQDGARFHVLSWNTIGTRCSEPNCEVNKVYNEKLDAAKSTVKE